MAAHCMMTMTMTMAMAMVRNGRQRLVPMAARSFVSYSSPSSSSFSSSSPRRSDRRNDRRNDQRSPRRGGGGGGFPSSTATETRDGERVPQVAGELLYGLHSVTQALASGHRRVHALYVRDGSTSSSSSSSSSSSDRRRGGGDATALASIHTMAEAERIETRPISKWMLNHLTGDKPHQGVVLDVEPLSLPTFEPLEPQDLAQGSACPVILALDELHDTQNLGAILRSAHFLGVSAVVLSERNSAPVSPAASRASAGALEVMVANNKLMRARNLHQALAISRDSGWRIVGACSGPNSITATQLASAQPTILVMGNEHRGLRKGIRQCCDEIVTIPGLAMESDSRVDSLNVSVATALLLYELLHH